MSKQLPPPPPNHLPEQPGFTPTSKYQRPRRFLSLWGVLAGLVLGVALGIAIAWGPAAPIEYDTNPDQLRQQDKDRYIAAIALAFSYDSDLGLALQRLTQLDIGADPFSAVADTACRLVKNGQFNSNAQVRALRSMTTFYQLQGRSGCADQWAAQILDPLEVTIEVATPTPTLPPPPPTKTPLPEQAATPTSAIVRVPTSAAVRQFNGRVQTFCDETLSGIIEVFVQDGGDGVPGQAILVQWDDGEDRFFTGLKPDRGPAYADFQMEAGQSYIISMPGLSEPLSTSLVADACFVEGGGEAITSYRVLFTR